MHLILLIEIDLCQLIVLVWIWLDTICGVPQGSLLGPILFLVNIYDLNCVIIYCKIYHFSVDINLSNFPASIKVINKQNNHDINILLNWLNANKIAHNISKTELVISLLHQKTTRLWTKNKVLSDWFSQISRNSFR